MRRVALFVLLGALLGFGAAAGVRSLGGGDGDGGDGGGGDAVVARYRKDVQPILDRGASIVGLGMKPGLSDVSARSLGDDALIGMTDDWVRALRTIRGDLDGLEAKPPVDDAHWLFGRALDAYVQAAEALRAAAGAGDDAARERLVDLAASLGESADALYDRAETTLAALDR